MAEHPNLRPIDAARLIFGEHKQKQQKRAYAENFNLIRFAKGWLKGRAKGKGGE